MDNATTKYNGVVEILIVGDNPAQAVQLRHIIEQHGYRVAAANNGLQALDYLEEHSPTIIISDIAIPEMDGYQLCSKIKSHPEWKEIPFILLTMLSNPEDIIKGLVTGADNLIIKPYDEKLLLLRIQYILANQALRKSMSSEIGVEIFFAGHRHHITSHRLQIIDLLLSTYESAVQKNEELQKTNWKLQELQAELQNTDEQLETKVRQRTENTQQLNRMLSAMRNVNKLIVREKDRERLLKAVCDSLIASHGFCSAWIVIINEAGNFPLAAEAGIGQSFLRLRQLLEKGDMPYCLRKALQQQLQVILSPGQKCIDCPLNGFCCEHRVIIARLEHQGKIYGAFSIAIADKFEVTPTEKLLVIELTQDISYALYNIEIEEQGQQAKEKLRQSETMYRSLFENTGTAMVIMDQDELVIKVNSRFEKLSGYSRQEVEGRMRWSQFIIEEQHHYLQRYETQRLSKNWEKKDSGQWEFSFIDKHEQRHDVFFKIMRIPDSDSSVASLIDITNRKRIERDLKESNDQLQHALDQIKKMQQQTIQQERLRALGQMASGIAHDFNNALTPMLGFSELLLSRPDYLSDRVKTHHYLDLIRSSAADAAEIVARLREFYRDRKQNQYLELCQLNDLIAETLSLTRPKWKNQAQAQGIEIVVELDLQQVPAIAVIKSEMREAFTNLIFNAIDAMPDGGVLKFATVATSDELIITISDTGSGMDEKTCHRCIEPFFSTKGQHGTGLGLAMVYGIVQRHNGRIKVKSVLGQGTSFFLHLPLKSECPTLPAPENMPELEQALHILVVEDEISVREVLTECLEALGHSVEGAGNGRDGLEKFRPDKFHLIITDRAMPEMNGDQFADAVKKIDKQIPIIMLTGFGVIMASTNERPKNVDMVVSKPISLEKLRSTPAKSSTAIEKFEQLMAKKRNTNCEVVTK